MRPRRELAKVLIAAFILTLLILISMINYINRVRCFIVFRGFLIMHSVLGYTQVGLAA